MEERILIGVVTLAFVVALRRQLVRAFLDPTPGGAVILTSTAYLVGATIVDWRIHSELSSLVYAACAVFLFVYLTAFWGCSAFFRLNQKAPEPLRIPNGNRSGDAKWVFLLVTLIGSVAVVYATGTERLLGALFRFVTGGDTTDSVLELRLALSSGEGRWLAPGYVKQLRDIVMPLSGLLVLFAIRRRTVRFALLCFTLVPVI